MEDSFAFSEAFEAVGHWEEPENPSKWYFFFVFLLAAMEFDYPQNKNDDFVWNFEIR